MSNDLRDILSGERGVNVLNPDTSAFETDGEGGSALTTLDERNRPTLADEIIQAERTSSGKEFPIPAVPEGRRSPTPRIAGSGNTPVENVVPDQDDDRESGGTTIDEARGGITDPIERMKKWDGFGGTNTNPDPEYSPERATLGYLSNLGLTKENMRAHERHESQKGNIPPKADDSVRADIKNEDDKDPYKSDPDYRTVMTGILEKGVSPNTRTRVLRRADTVTDLKLDDATSYATATVVTPINNNTPRTPYSLNRKPSVSFDLETKSERDTPRYSATEKGKRPLRPIEESPRFTTSSTPRTGKSAIDESEVVARIYQKAADEEIAANLEEEMKREESRRTKERFEPWEKLEQRREAWAKAKALAEVYANGDPIKELRYMDNFVYKNPGMGTEMDMDQYRKAAEEWQKSQIKHEAIYAERPGNPIVDVIGTPEVTTHESRVPMSQSREDKPDRHKKPKSSSEKDDSKKDKGMLPGIQSLREQSPGEKLLSNFGIDTEGYKPVNQLADVGYLGHVARSMSRGIADSSDPDPSDSSSDSDSTTPSSIHFGDDPRTLKRKKKYQKKQLAKAKKRKEETDVSSRVKIDEPEKWDGSANFTSYEQWLYHVNHWFRSTGYPIKMRSAHIGRFLKSRALEWFMNLVAPNPDEWTVQSIGLALFNQFFPPNLRSKFRREFEIAHQGKFTFKEYVQTVKNLAARVPDITQRQIILRVWWGAHKYLREKWIDHGLDSESSSLQQIEILGERFELSEGMGRAEKGGIGRSQVASQAIRPLPPSDDLPERRNNNFKNKKFVGNKPQKTAWKPNNNRIGRQTSWKSNSEQNGQQKKRWNNGNDKQKLKRTYDGPKLSKEEMDVMRAENRCFKCKEVGHMARDCPENRKLKPPGIKANLVTFDLEELNDLSQAQDTIALMSVQLIDDNAPEQQRLLDKIREVYEERFVYFCAAEDALLRDVEPRNRLTFSIRGRYLRVADKLEMIPLYVPMDRLEEENFDLEGWLNEQHDWKVKSETSAEVITRMKSHLSMMFSDYFPEQEALQNGMRSRYSRFHVEYESDLKDYVVYDEIPGKKSYRIYREAFYNRQWKPEEVTEANNSPPTLGVMSLRFITNEQPYEGYDEYSDSSPEIDWMVKEPFRTPESSLTPLLNLELELKECLISGEEPAPSDESEDDSEAERAWGELIQEKWNMRLTKSLACEPAIIAGLRPEDRWGWGNFRTEVLIVDKLYPGFPLEITTEDITKPLFDIMNAIDDDPIWRLKKVASESERRQTAEIIQDDFANFHPWFEALNAGITKRERFHVRPLGEETGYIIQDRLKSPGMWVVSRDQLAEDEWRAMNILEADFQDHERLVEPRETLLMSTYAIGTIPEESKTASVASKDITHSEKNAEGDDDDIPDLITVSDSQDSYIFELEDMDQGHLEKIEGRNGALYSREEIFDNPRLIKRLDKLTDNEISFLKGDLVVTDEEITTDDLFSVIIMMQGGDNLAWNTAPMGMDIKTKMSLCYIDYEDMMIEMEEYNPMVDPITEVSISALTPIAAAKKGIPYKPPKIDPNAPALLRNIQRNAAKPKDFNRKVPEPLVIFPKIDGKEVRALIDTGSLADFVSTTVADQLKLTLEPLKKPLPCALAASGSRTMIQYSTTVEFEYQNINETRRFDIINLDTYDMILGTPFLWQHSMLVGLNPYRIAVGKPLAQKLEGKEIAMLTSMATNIVEAGLNRLREQLKEEVKDLCKSANETPLPPLRAVNHTIPLIDEGRVYKWRPSRCPEAIRPFWNEKRDQYLKCGRWRFRAGRNASPMMIVPKKDGPGGIKRWRTVVDKREANDNTKKLASPLPNMEAILTNVLRHKYRSLIDGRDAYEQIRVVPEHVHRTLFNTPDGTMESLVLQLGDCNGGATYQALMNHIFGPYIGVFMDVYLDDIIVYSDTIEDHMKHLRIIFDVLRRERLYLTSADKLEFFAKRFTLLGHVIDDNGLVMDPDKVDQIGNWKTPNSRELLASFLGAVGFLAPDCKSIRIPMAVLTPIAGSKSIWKWGPTEQRAFDQIKDTVRLWRSHHRKPIDYSANAPPINLVCDASLTGAGGTISQGERIEDAQIAAFWSAKFNSAQQNYPVHDRELLAIIESLKRFKHLLQGTRFRIWTDHKPLKYLGTQQNLSARQHRWMDTLCEFDYTVHYIPGHSNIMADALSRIYSNEAVGVQRAKSEHIDEFGNGDPEGMVIRKTSIYSGPEIETQYQLSASNVEVEGRITRSKTGALRPTLLPTSDKLGTAIMPLTEAARQEILKPKRGRNKKDKTTITSVSGEESAMKEPVGETERDITPDRASEFDPDIAGTELSTHKDDLNLEYMLPTQDLAVPDQMDPKDTHTVDDIEPENGKEQTLDTELDTDATETGLTPLQDLIAHSEPLLNFPGALVGLYEKDSFFSQVYKTPERYRNFVTNKGLLYITVQDTRRLCIPDAIVQGRNVRKLLMEEAHIILAHLGYRKTLHFIRESFWWPNMARDIRKFCETCNTCATAKAKTQKPEGLLKTLPVPDRPWQSIGIDFMGPLKESTNRNGSYDMIAVAIDHLTAMVHIMPYKQTYTAKDTAEMVFDYIYKHHGLPDHIVSDRDRIFNSDFWSILHKLIGTQLRFSTAYHPETDGSTERANRTIMQMLRQCVNDKHDDWVGKLPAIEYAMNSARSDITGYTPFFLNSGRTAKPMIFDVPEKEFKGIKLFAQKVKDAIMDAHDAILTARVKQTTYANKKRRPATFKLHDLVYLSTENINFPKGTARKMVPKFIGPFLIDKVVVPDTSYRLELSPDLKRRGIHNVFHAKLLRIHHPNDDRRFPGRSSRILEDNGNDNVEWMVEKILSHRGRGFDATFEVLWKSGDKAWMDYPAIRHLAILDQYLELCGVSSIGALPRSNAAESIHTHIASSSVRLADLPADIKKTSSTGPEIKDPIHSNRLTPVKQLPIDMDTLDLPPVHDPAYVNGMNRLYSFWHHGGDAPMDLPNYFFYWMLRHHNIDLLGLTRDSVAYKKQVETLQNDLHRLKSWNDELEERVRALITTTEEKKVGERLSSGLFTLPNGIFDPSLHIGTIKQGEFGFAEAFVQQAASHALFANPNGHNAPRTQPFRGTKGFKQSGNRNYRPGGSHYRNQSWKRQNPKANKGKSREASSSGVGERSNGGPSNKAGSMNVEA